jgi:hypothetical protein
MATVGWNGGFWQGYSDLSSMFDDKPHTMVHSKGTRGEGPSIVFEEPIVG